MFLFFDPLYLLFALPGVLLALWAQAKVKSAYAEASKIESRSGLTGAEIAERILRTYEIHDIGVEPTRGLLTDHYDPISKRLRLSVANYEGDSLAALGISAHEVGHAIQHKTGYIPMMLRHFIVPVASLGTNLSYILFMIGLFMSYGSKTHNPVAEYFMLGAIVLFGGFFLFTLITLPVEFNASRRALRILREHNIVSAYEIEPIKKVLNAAALTYVAAAAQALMILLYFILVFLGRRD